MGDFGTRECHETENYKYNCNYVPSPFVTTRPNLFVIAGKPAKNRPVSPRLSMVITQLVLSYLHRKNIQIVGGKNTFLWKLWWSSWTKKTFISFVLKAAQRWEKNLPFHGGREKNSFQNY